MFLNTARNIGSGVKILPCHFVAVFFQILECPFNVSSVVKRYWVKQISDSVFCREEKVRRRSSLHKVHFFQHVICTSPFINRGKCVKSTDLKNMIEKKTQRFNQRSKEY